jgi:hypothetical protein
VDLNLEFFERESLSIHRKITFPGERFDPVCVCFIIAQLDIRQSVVVAMANNKTTYRREPEVRPLLGPVYG